MTQPREDTVMNKKTTSLNFLQVAFFLCLAAIISSCAGMRDMKDGAIAGGSDDMADRPCDECGNRGDVELKITDEVYYREWNQAAYSRIDSSAVVGVFPALKVTAGRTEKCRFCHSYSADALDFDLARVEDSLFVKAFPKMQRELMLPGMRLPDADSSYFDTLAVKILMSKFADGMKLEDFTPWTEREGIEQPITRYVPAELKNLLNDIATRYELRYISIPIRLDVFMDPDLGKSGGFTYKILWTFWDARYGELVFLTYSGFTAATTSRVAPEKEWSEPFAERLWTMFSTDVMNLEAH